jgi:hypothetical protein
MYGQNKVYVEEHREDVTDYIKGYHKENKDVISIRKAEYYVENKDEIKERKADYYTNNATRVKRKVKEYRDTNVEIVKERRKRYFKTPAGKMAKSRDKHRRRDAQKKTKCTLTLAQWNIILKRQGNKCIGYPAGTCNVIFTNDNPPKKDHIWPVSKDGPFTFENTQALCNRCNCRKHNKIDYANIVSYLTYE